MAARAAASSSPLSMPKGRRVPFEALPDDVKQASRAISKLWEEEDKQAAEAKVELADLTAETVTVGDITIPIPSPLADFIIREHLQDRIKEKVENKEIVTPGQLTHEAYCWIATQWWVLDNQYKKDKDGQLVIKRFMREPGWRPADDELLDYLGQFSFGGSRLQDFYDAYRTATSFENAGERAKKARLARQTGQVQKIAVLRPFISQSET